MERRVLGDAGHLERPEVGHAAASETSELTPTGGNRASALVQPETATGTTKALEALKLRGPS